MECEVMKGYTFGGDNSWCILQLDLGDGPQYAKLIVIQKRISDLKEQIKQAHDLGLFIHQQKLERELVFSEKQNRASIRTPFLNANEWSKWRLFLPRTYTGNDLDRFWHHIPDNMLSAWLKWKEQGIFDSFEIWGTRNESEFALIGIRTYEYNPPEIWLLGRWIPLTADYMQPYHRIPGVLRERLQESRTGYILFLCGLIALALAGLSLFIKSGFGMFCFGVMGSILLGLSAVFEATLGFDSDVRRALKIYQQFLYEKKRQERQRIRESESASK